ncbi:MAG TPA: hypothetical protein VJU61_27265 [Polyangiaceae bacterium]|nr:hypothetical protein [Polyangiaceae bacterium]
MPQLDEAPITATCPVTPALSTLDLLALAGRSAARIACEQSLAVEMAARLFEAAAANEATVWIAGDAAYEHARRLEAAGHRAVALVDPTRLPANVRPGDLLFVVAVGELPIGLLPLARQREVDSIVLGGTERRQLDADAVMFVDCHDERAAELTHSFIVTALCTQYLEIDRAESAA